MGIESSPIIDSVSKEYSTFPPLKLYLKILNGNPPLYNFNKGVVKSVIFVPDIESLLICLFYTFSYVFATPSL